VYIRQLKIDGITAPCYTLAKREKIMSDRPEFYLTTDPQLVALREGLREVMDPEIGMSIVELGLVRTAEIQPEGVHIMMIMTTPFCPYSPAILEGTRQKSQEVTGLTATVEMGIEMWSPEMMEEGAGGEWGLF
jgi:metal-sulfur cluster biosynthetic enzyme